MGTYYVCSDNIDGKEQSRINALIDALKKHGHEAINGGVGPNTVQSHGQSGSSSGQIGVFICGGVDIQVFWDFVQGIGSYYHYKRFIYVYASDTATTDKWLTCNGAKNTPTVQAHDDNYSGGRGDAIGKTVHQYCSEHKDKIWYACGKLGCTFQDVINNFLAGIGAGDDGKGDSSASTIKEAIKEVASFWDGEVEIKVEQDTVKLRKIPDPETDHLEESIIEGTNVELNSISIQDYHPDTINILTVHWQGGEDIILKDEDLIARFGEKKKEMDAVKRVVSGGGQSAASNMANSQNLRDKSTVSNSSDENNTNKFNKFIKSQGNNNTNLTGAAGEDTDTESDTDTDSDTETESTTYEEVPVTTYEEALHFANVEWAKIRRDNGHEIELKCIGNVNYKHRWVKVKLYSYPTDMWMYIKSVNHEISENGEFGTNITLVDYPPSLGEWNENDSDEESEDEEEETTDEDV